MVVCVYSPTGKRYRKAYHGNKSGLPPPPPRALGASPRDGFWSGHNESFLVSATVITKLLREHEAFPSCENLSRQDFLKETWAGLKAIKLHRELPRC